MEKTKPLAAVYDRWLFTLGGGEQVAFAYAEALRDLGYRTSLLTHQKIDVEKAQRKMNVNLRDISIEYLPLSSSQELSEYTEKYDVFINTSYLDYFANRSKKGILSIFFPSQIVLTPYEYVKRAIVLPSFTKLFVYPSQFEGFKFDEYRKGQIYKWLGKESSITFNNTVTDVTLQLYLQTMTVSVIDQFEFWLDGKLVQPYQKQINDRTNQVSFSFHLGTAKYQKLSLKLPDSPYAESIALIKLTIHDWRYILYNWFKSVFPKWEMRLHGGPGVTKLSDLTSYAGIVTISDFCQKWIKNYWGLPSQVLYPPVHTTNFSTSPNKKNWIVHVGRFFVTGHSKKQLELLKEFRKLVDAKKVTDWELHFVGSVHEGQKHQEYFEQIKYYAQGYPVVFHMDAPFTELQSVLSQAKIYWHATGLDEDEQKNPILFEHFGITTVEAMASGCVPVVINAGGQKEIVTPEAGFLWNTREQLRKYTSKLIEDPALWKTYQQQAIERSKYFDQSNFAQRFAKILEKL